MVSQLFDPVIELAMITAKKKKSIAPPRLVPLLSFKTLPPKARETIIEVVDEDEEFRTRVSKRVVEAKHGRFAFSYLTRPDGWETFVSQMIELSDEPFDSPAASAESPENPDSSDSSNGDIAGGEDIADEDSADEDIADGDGGQTSAYVSKVDEVVAKTTNSVKTATESGPDEKEIELESESSQDLLASTNAELDDAKRANAELTAEIESLRKEVEDLTEQRKRAVSELKKTESIMNRHIAARKQVEETLAQMTSAQLSSAAVGGAITDIEVRVGLDAIDEAIAQVNEQVSTLRRASTPERVPVARRVPLAPPLGIVDDSTEFATYLLSIPNSLVFIDGYNVTKSAVPNLDLENQRNWLEQKLTALSATSSGHFEVIFDGADVSVATRSDNSRVRIRFSPDGVEADDVIIDAVEATATNTVVVVVSSDKRVRDGASRSGANVLHTEQFTALLPK